MLVHEKVKTKTIQKQNGWHIKLVKKIGSNYKKWEEKLKVS
jgi:hypothetical protein